MRLQDLIRQFIQENGAMPFDVFQEVALYHPKMGYYNTQPIFGERGDFVTAPDISQMFGEMVGLWLLDLWRQMGSPCPFQLIELGPGRGTFMADILKVTRLDGAFLRAAQVHLVEISPPLRAEQQKRLKDASASVAWFCSPCAALSQGKGPLFVVANEFFDAIPTKQYQKKAGIWEERFVDFDADQGKFCFTTKKASFEENPPFPQGKEGDVWEFSPPRDKIFHQLVQSIKEREGCFWICDYGYAGSFPSGGDSLLGGSSPSGRGFLLGDSVQGIYRQEKSSPLDAVGLSDLSSHVNFGRFQEIAKQYGASGLGGVSDLGPVGMGTFLKALGMGQRLTQLKRGKSQEACAQLQAGYERLTHPLQMGVLFQVYTVYNPDHLIPCGFERSF